MRLSGINGCETIVVKCYTLSDQVLQTTTKEKEEIQKQKIQKYKNTKYKNTKIQKYKNAKIQKYKNTRYPMSH